MEKEKKMENEGTVDYFVDQLIKSPPQSEKSIQLQILNEDNNTDKDIFNILIEIFTKLMKQLHGNNNGEVNLDNLTEKDSIIINNYYKSFGMVMYFEKYNMQNNIVFKNYNNLSNSKSKSKLNEDCLNIKTNNFKYKFFFDFL